MATSVMETDGVRLCLCAARAVACPVVPVLFRRLRARRCFAVVPPSEPSSSYSYLFGSLGQFSFVTFVFLQNNEPNAEEKPRGRF